MGSLFGRKFQGPLGRCWSGHCGVARVADMDHKRNASIASAMSGAGSDFMSAEDDEPVTLEGSPLPLASPRAEVVRMKGAQTFEGFNKQSAHLPPPVPIHRQICSRRGTNTSSGSRRSSRRRSTRANRSGTSSTRPSRRASPSRLSGTNSERGWSNRPRDPCPAMPRGPEATPRPPRPRPPRSSTPSGSSSTTPRRPPYPPRRSSRS